MSLINREALYEKACGLEAHALSYIEKIIHDEDKVEEWKIWSAILTERTAFKYDIFDAPEVKPQRKKGTWIDKGWNGDWHYQMDGRGTSWHGWQCSECNHITKGAKWNFCPKCGAEMTEESEE